MTKEIEEKIEQAPNMNQTIIPIVEPTELGESLRMLNEDLIEEQTRMSNIDLRSRLHPVEVAHILAVDSLVQLNVLPVKCLGFTRQKKRLAVSENGLGRREYVEVVAGKREVEERTGLMGKLGGLFKKDNKV